MTKGTDIRLLLRRYAGVFAAMNVAEREMRSIAIEILPEDVAHKVIIALFAVDQAHMVAIDTLHAAARELE